MTPAREAPPISRATLRFFRGIVRRYLRRHFRSVMIQHSEYLRQVQGPLVIYANHSSWWDPMVSVLLGEKLSLHRNHYAPMDATALAKYPILRRIGIFPVDLHSARGAAQFLRTCEAVLAHGGVLWITPQGRFADPREALSFKPGLGALAARVPNVTLLPMAIEYTFWNERLPETLMRFGEPLQIPEGTEAAAATMMLESALAATMAGLKAAVLARNPQSFEVLLEGGRGTGGVYGWIRRVRALLTQQPLSSDHTPRPSAENTDAGSDA
jgi:1-acyl-sn-glycerol-3-phosphate acyltransferase